MSASSILILAMVVDALVGEPVALWRRVPHPAVVMGNTIRWCDQRFNTPTATTRTAGTLVVLALVLCAGAVGSLLSLFGPVVEVLVLAILLAQRSLVDHVRGVATGLRMSLAEGRQAVAMIVSRDTADMEKSAIARSAIESGAENMSDGVIAPAFWFLVGGLPGLLIYKIVNTGDSMIGYRTPLHEHFGWAAARLDDLLNLIPARLTAVLIALPGGVIGDWRAIAADARLHKSPNAGWPEAAMARAIDVALAGPRAYDGVMQPFAWVNKDGQRDLDAGHIDAAVKRLWQAWVMMLVLLLCVMMF